MVNYKLKYLEYKMKYINAKNKLRGGTNYEFSFNDRLKTEYPLLTIKEIDSSNTTEGKRIIDIINDELDIFVESPEDYEEELKIITTTGRSMGFLSSPNLVYPTFLYYDLHTKTYFVNISKWTYIKSDSSKYFEVPLDDAFNSGFGGIPYNFVGKGIALGKINENNKIEWNLDYILNLEQTDSNFEGVEEES